MSGRISALGLDIGKKRIGVAGCDGTGLIATPLTTITRVGFTDDVAKLQQLIAEREVTILVIGLPYSLAGEWGKQAQRTEKYAERLASVLKLPIEYMDERLTSIEAETQLKTKRGFSPRRDKAQIDAHAAAIILQQWLDHKRLTSH
ncbi:Holliday junction resolvase RuvX [Dactylococcopsis salina]|uniref:Putative pre-16S rRNA nuclease n=1 Tax=Dactylococcopsis salina (strain PCC 8305) TaxID=13035 RepID=K9YYW5_DACS8|nr:Holliday junction resolvase RuvX [Dactylococcopsis salina]AFZ51298.1 RNAse H-fold protein YqgF [Dactylococcopsis salina PCC 8305]